jgi:hypothetical protein
MGVDREYRYRLFADACFEQLATLPVAARPDCYNDPGQSERECHEGGQMTHQIVGVHPRRPADEKPWQCHADGHPYCVAPKV